ncbi:MAG TPA: nuclear transport factor 2 family protein [Anaerolineae bacterium]|jgi:predicted ester cyclase
MTPIEIVTATIAAIQAHDVTAASVYAADEFTVTDPNLPRAVGKTFFFGQMAAMFAAFPDWHYDIHTMAAQGDCVTVELTVHATHTAPLQLGGTALKPTGKQISIDDKFHFTVRENLIIALRVDSPPGGGAPAMMRQLGLT